MSDSIELIGVDKALKLIVDLPANTRLAASRAINDTLKDVQTATGDKILPDAFTLRGRGKQWWEPGQKFGFNIKPYSKPETLEGRMGSQADWLKLQEFGGDKRIEGHKVAVPAADYKPNSAIMSRDLKPRFITQNRDIAAKKLADAENAIAQHRGVRLASSADKLRRHNLKLQLRGARRAFKLADAAHRAHVAKGAGAGNKAFIAHMKSGFVGVFKRVGASRNPLKLLFSFKGYTHLHPALGFEKAAQALAEEKYDRKFAIRFLEVLK